MSFWDPPWQQHRIPWQIPVVAVLQRVIISRRLGSNIVQKQLPVQTRLPLKSILCAGDQQSSCTKVSNLKGGLASGPDKMKQWALTQCTPPSPAT